MSDKYHVIGTDVLRIDAYSKVTGDAVFGADINQPNQLYGAICRSPYPHARILSIDTSAAKALPGVRAVVTGKDRPIYYGAVVGDEPFMAVDKVRYFGESVAGVAADTLEIAEEAVKLIKVEYEVLPVVTDAKEAIKPDAPVLHENWNAYSPKGKPAAKGNLCDVFKLRKGNVDEGFKEAEVIVENEFKVSQISHTTIETHVATVMVNNKGQVTCWTSAQSPFVTRNYFVNALKCSQNDVRIIGTYVGGAFGNKYDLRAEASAYMLAQAIPNRPVKVVFDRFEDFTNSVTRGECTVHIKTGCKKDGKLVAIETYIYWDTGAYVTMGPNVAKNGAIASFGPYECPNVKIDSLCIVTNKPVCGAYRGFGVPETNWASENQMDAVAEKLGIDPLKFRQINALHEGGHSVTNEELFSVGLPESLDRAKEMMGWKDNEVCGVRPNGKLWGRGVACFLKMTSSPSTSAVVVKLNEDGTVVIESGGSEQGQGSQTMSAQIVLEELGIPFEQIILAGVDTQYTPYDKSTTSSRHTFMMGNAMIDACRDIKEQLINRAAYSWKLPHEEIFIQDGFIRTKDGSHEACIAKINKSDLAKEMPPIVGHGFCTTKPVIKPTDPETGMSARPTAFWIYGTQASEVEVDPETGEVEVVKYAAAHDCGKALNLHTCKQQVEGAIVMGLGHALREELLYIDGMPKNANMVDYKVPTVRDFTFEPDICFVDAPHREGPYGAKGVGETALTATCSAAGLAVAHAIGARLTQIPIKPEVVLEALKNRNA